MIVVKWVGNFFVRVRITLEFMVLGWFVSGSKEDVFDFLEDYNRGLEARIAVNRWLDSDFGSMN